MKTGRPIVPRPLLPNPGEPGTMLVPLSRGYFAIIDESDAGIVGAHNWAAVTDPRRSRPVIYAMTNMRRSGGGQVGVRLHRFLWTAWGCPDTPEIDHENTNGLDCRRANLRPATTSQNCWNRPAYANNTSGLKGVTWHKDSRKWAAQITRFKRHHHLGLFESPNEAHEAYVAAALRLHGEFARTGSFDEAWKEFHDAGAAP